MILSRAPPSAASIKGIYPSGRGWKRWTKRIACAGVSATPEAAAPRGARARPADLPARIAFAVPAVALAIAIVVLGGAAFAVAVAAIGVFALLEAYRLLAIPLPVAVAAFTPENRAFMSLDGLTIDGPVLTEPPTDLGQTPAQRAARIVGLTEQ